MKMQLDIGPIHFVGIGGIGMSGIAEIMNNLGYNVQGSDLADSANVKRLRKMGVSVTVGHGADNLGDAKVLVVSSAVKRDNPELVEARARFLPVVRRAEMLAELMRLKSCIAVAGTHGKTTTTSMVAALLDAGGIDPTVINGGIINAYGTNARLGHGEWMVVEADESDGTFVKLPAEIAIVTNIDPEHLDHYGTFDKAREAFYRFVEQLPFYGFAVMCSDHPEVQALIGRIEDRRIFTYGTNRQADFGLENIVPNEGGQSFDVVVDARVNGEELRIENINLPMPGRYNALNATAAIAVAQQLGMSAQAIVEAMASFGGVKRRFTRTGAWNDITIYDDYAHHPVEISSVLKAAHESARGKVIAVMQPHRYSRLHDLFDEFCGCFNDADTVIVTPVYEAGEDSIKGADRDGLVTGILARGHHHVAALEGPQALAVMIKELAEPGDLVICLGAGSISAWAYALPGELERLEAAG